MRVFENASATKQLSLDIFSRITQAGAMEAIPAVGRQHLYLAKMWCLIYSLETSAL
jgi:hypothetical protein